jgi:hypothetical protein
MEGDKEPVDHPTGEDASNKSPTADNQAHSAKPSVKTAQADAAADSSTNQATKTVPGSIEEISENPDQSLPFPRYQNLEEVIATKKAKDDESVAKKKAVQHKVGTVTLPEPNKEVQEEEISYNQWSKDTSSASNQQISQAESSEEALANSIAEDIEYLRRTTVSSMGFTDIIDTDESNHARQPCSREIPGVTEVTIDSSRWDSLVGSMGNTAVTPSTAHGENDASVSIVPEAYLVTPEDEEAFMLRHSSIRDELIQEPEPEVMEAKPVDFCHWHGRTIALLSFFILVGLGIFVGVAFSK